MEHVSQDTSRAISKNSESVRLNPLARQLLKGLLRFQKVFQGRVVDRVMIRAFGVHPKNIFHFRARVYLPYLSSTDRVIDLASGSGITLGWLAPHIAAGMGLELSVGAVSGARARNRHPHLSFDQADILTADYNRIRDEFNYSVAVYSHILEHLDDPIGLIERVGAGRIIICVPSEDNWYRQLLKFLELDHRSDPSHRCEFTFDSLRTLVERAGYREQVIAYNSEGELYCVADRRD